MSSLYRDDWVAGMRIAATHTLCTKILQQRRLVHAAFSHTAII